MVTETAHITFIKGKKGGIFPLALGYNFFILYKKFPFELQIFKLDCRQGHWKRDLPEYWVFIGCHIVKWVPNIWELVEVRQNKVRKISAMKY